MNVEQLMEVLGVSESDLSPSSSEFEMQGDCKICFIFDLWATLGVQKPVLKCVKIPIFTLHSHVCCAHVKQCFYVSLDSHCPVIKNLH